MVIDPYLLNETREFNPADLENLVRFCVQELESRPSRGLPLPAPFDGAGIYALYYDGDFSLYQHPSIRSPDRIQPIYVGRARFTSRSGPQPLFKRLTEHAESIAAAANLEINDFSCRFLVLHPIWVSTVEDLLIRHFDTLWNGVMLGFGSHDPGGKRHTGKLSIWDTVHPGRPHEELMQRRGASTRALDEIQAAIDAFGQRRAVHPSSHSMSTEVVDQVLRRASLGDDDE